MRKVLMVDGGNLYFSLRERGLLPVSMEAVAERIAPGGRKRFYTAPFRGHGKFLTALEKSGWTVRILRTRKRFGEEGVDVALAVDMVLQAAAGTKEIVLVSGDADLVPAVEAAQALGAKVTVWAFQGELSPDLARAVDEVGLLDGLPWKELAYKKAV